MSYTLDDRDALIRAFYRLTGTSSDDDGLEEFDNEENEAVHFYIQQGLWEAQHWIISTVDPWRWHTKSAALSWSGSDDADGGRYTDLPEDFLRLAGDADSSALRLGNGTPWGMLLDEPRRRFDVWGNYYYLVGDQLWIAGGANPPSDLYLHYHHRHAVLEDETEIDFPLLDRPLIVGFAAEMYSSEASLPGDSEMLVKINTYLDRAKRRAFSRGRRTHEPLRLKPKDTFGTQFFV